MSVQRGRGLLIAATTLLTLWLAAGCGSGETEGAQPTTSAGGSARTTGSGAQAGKRADWQVVARLPLDMAPEQLSLRTSPRGGGVVSWEDYEQEPPRIASVVVDPQGVLGTVTEVAPPQDAPRPRVEVKAPTRMTGQSVHAVGKGGRGIVAFAASGREGGGLLPDERRVYAWPTLTRENETTFGRRLDLGPNDEKTQLSAAVLPSGSAGVLWGTQDAGEEANQPWRVRFATIRTDGVTTRELDPGGIDRPTGAPKLVATPEGRFVALWSSVRKYDDRPLVAAVSNTGGEFDGAPQQLASSSYGNGLAVGPDGTVLATWSEGTVESALLAPGSTRFVKEFRTGPASESSVAPGFTGRGEPLIVSEDAGELVVRVRR